MPRAGTRVPALGMSGPGAAMPFLAPEHPAGHRHPREHGPNAENRSHGRPAVGSPDHHPSAPPGCPRPPPRSREPFRPRPAAQVPAPGRSSHRSTSTATATS